MSDSATSLTVPARILCPRNSSGKNTGVGGHSILQGLFWIQGFKQSPALWAVSLSYELPGKPMHVKSLQSRGKHVLCVCVCVCDVGSPCACVCVSHVCSPCVCVCESCRKPVCVCVCVCVYKHINPLPLEHSSYPPSHPSRSSQNMELSSLCYSEASH